MPRRKLGITTKEACDGLGRVGKALSTASARRDQHLQACSHLVLCSDFHLSDKAPACRRHAGEEAWVEHQCQAMAELERYEGPCICAGDLFDEPYRNPLRPSPGLINIALANLPNQFYVTPGQHDLPGHSMDLIPTTAIQTLNLAGRAKVLNFKHDSPFVNDWLVIGYPWGFEPPAGSLEAVAESSTLPILAVTHRLAWMGEPPFPGAPEEGNAHNLARQFKGAKVLLTGDNHQAFVYRPNDPGLPVVVNPGSLMRIRSNQVELTGFYTLFLDQFNNVYVDWRRVPDSLELVSANEAAMPGEVERGRFKPFVEALGARRRGSVSYEANIHQVLESVKPRRGVKVRVLDSLKEETP